MKNLEDQLEQAPAGASLRRAEALALPVMARPLRYALRMVVFLAVVGMVAALLHEHAARFLLRYPPLNTLILCVLALGIGLSFRAVLSLDPEVSWIQHFRLDAPGLVAGSPPLLGPLAAMLRHSKGRLSFSANGLRSVLDGVDSRLEERRETSRYLIALLIFLGLLGTFWGLLMTANSVGETIRGLNVVGSDPVQMFETLRAGLEAPLAGMGTAFSTSLFGLASSLVLGFLDLQASQAQNRFANELETWLMSLGRLDAVQAWDESEPVPSYLRALLAQTVENLDELQRRMARAMDESTSVNATLRARRALGEPDRRAAGANRHRRGGRGCPARDEGAGQTHRHGARGPCRRARRYDTLASQEPRCRRRPADRGGRARPRARGRGDPERDSIARPHPFDDRRPATLSMARARVRSYRSPDVWPGYAADIDGGTCTQFERNFTFSNEDGIRASAGAKWNRYRNNLSKDNDLKQSETASDAAGRHNGLMLTDSTTANNFVGNVAFNTVRGPSDDGLKFFGADGNCATGNKITNFCGTTNAQPSSDETWGCEIFNSSNNKVFGNTFSGNFNKNCTTPADFCKVISGSGNCGDSIPGAPACSITTCPPLFKSESSSAPCAASVEPIP